MPTQPVYWKVLTRRKILNNEPEGEVKLNRVLGLFDLTALGVGSTLGAGVYVLAGQIAKDQAGPSVMISFAIAALASALAGICYAEFGARVPKAGSAYTYSYVCIGEFIAFVIGWNLILEYIIGTAGVCRGISLYLDTVLNDALKTCFAEIAPIQWNFLGEYFDFLAFTLAIVFGVVTAFGVETSTILNNLCTILNILVLLFVIIAGSFKADISNWQVDASANFTGIDDNIGKGGYFPFGLEGTLKGAATCFFGFVGFDCIATTGEEVRNPQKNIPRSIVYSLLIIFICYFGVSTVLTLMVPYYSQDRNAPLPYAFKEVGWNFAMWIVTIGGLIGLLASLFGALFPIPRIIYSMSEDGLIFRFLGRVSPRFKTPVIGSIFAAILTGIIAGIFDLPQLVNLLSIGTLLAYTVVAISITIIRFMDSDYEINSLSAQRRLSENSMLTSNGTKITLKIVILQFFNYYRISTPNYLSTKIVGTLILFFSIVSLLCALLIKNAGDAIINHELWAIALLSIFIVLIVTFLTGIWLQPKELHTSIFRVPLVPLIPATSIFINIYLMLQLDVTTWIRFGVWMVIGLPVFIICYCTFDKSNENIKYHRTLFMKALGEKNIIYNNQLEVIEKGVCNNSIKVLSSQSPIKDAKQTGNENEFYKLTINKLKCASFLRESKIDHALDYNSTLGAHQLETKREKLKKKHVKTITIEEKSVIAMLDDILENEDDDVNKTDYIEQVNIDTENGQTFLKTTTTAVIHNCSMFSSEYKKTNDTNNKLNSSDQLYIEVRKIAFNLIDEIFQSEELVLAVEAKLKYQDEGPQSIHLMNNGTKSSVVGHPLHSINFKNKLSLLIGQQHSLSKLNKNIYKSSAKSDFIQRLQLPKSKVDMRVAEKNESTGNYKDSQNIPKPPKFNPELYKTVGNRGNRTGSNINKLISERPIEKPVKELINEIPFKTKLEAILKRGPSQFMQKQSDFAIPQIPSVDNFQFLKKPLREYKFNLPHGTPTALLRTIQTPSIALHDIETINDIRKRLRHVNLGDEK